ncbi:serine hydrolase domain-containing protein [Alkalihalobacterium alkalinitrilicum]|uniref:serine hydrolase domain-containing protein n=1 Tax=Alkalihalobacterium alkalinitrilicum TaxID=427920 RepID=UPI0009951FFC|nr:serine hydrolase domain-containing protein [Alkalihalobacterium alkalinitrilicum]
MQTKSKEKIIKSIEHSFRKKVQKDKNLKSACLLVHSETNGIHINIADGLMDTNQPVYMASVGKLFTSVIISMLYENGKLMYDDKITNYLEPSLLEKIHVYNGKNYTEQIQIKHLLKHTSGLPDFFHQLLNQLLKDHNFNLSPEEAITWAKIHQKPHFPPGDGFKYSDTNYHLLGLIIEKLTQLPLHEAIHQYIYEPLEMTHSSFLFESNPIDKKTLPVADFYVNHHNITNFKGYSGIDYAGSGVVSTGEDLLKFMKALTSHQLVKKETLEKMKRDNAKYGVGIDYGYGMMQFKPVPLLMPKKFTLWGHAGITGAFMFYHPKLDTYVIGTFNDFSYERKGVKFMLMNVINRL